MKKLDEIRKMVTPSAAFGPNVKFHVDGAGILHLTQATMRGYDFQRLIELLGFDVAEYKRLCDVERQKYEEYVAQNIGKVCRE